MNLLRIPLSDFMLKYSCKMMINGIESMRLSKRSKNPPWPGMDLPESFIAIVLLNSDSTRSPYVPTMTTMAEIVNHCHSARSVKTKELR